MTEAADFETLLRRAFAPVDPPAGLSDRVEDRLTRLNELAWDELESWELQALGDPRNWTRLARPIAAGVVATLVAELLGAVNLGTALTFGQMAIVGAVLALMLRGSGRRRRDDRERPTERDRR